MERYVIHFLRASLLWLAAGAALGVAMTIHSSWVIYRTAHLHMLFLGFITMMIAGVAYQVLPRFAATRLYSRRLAEWHLVLANAGLALLAAGFVVRYHAPATGEWLLGTGGVLSAAGGFMLAWNLWRTLDRAVTPARRAASTRPLPTKESS